ncbi:MAG: ATP-dependent DNA helicase RecG [Thermoanaerobaculia bacterium]
MRLDGPLTQLRGVGPARAGQLADAGFHSLRDLLFHLPTRYEDRRRVSLIRELEAPGDVTLRGRVLRVQPVRVRRRNLSLVRGTVDDGTGTLPALWFNRPYLTDWLQPDREYLLHGELRRGRGGALELLNPSCEPIERAVHAARVVPVYAAVGGLGPAALRRVLGLLVAGSELEAEIGEYLPREILRRYSLPPVGRALAQLHAPDGDAPVEDLNAWRSPAHLRLIYGELLELQLELALLRREEVKRQKPHRYRIDDRAREAARLALPFKLTAAQKRVLREIVDDLRSPYPMLRLLQGDVGSGKTIVAALALIVAMESGLQGAFMAPTELLAEQHFRTLDGLLGTRYRLALMTRSAADRGEAAAGLGSGAVQLAVGTHAIIQEGVEFRRLGLAVVDEQHRFGVLQRREMQSKGRLPDMLVMTATPIPRSLALTVYGDLELSVLDELPPGRRPIATELAPASRRKDVYRRLRQAVGEGEQAYVVFPLIGESEKVQAESIEAMGERVRSYLGSLPSAVLHGRMAADERDSVMGAFVAGDVRVLVATTVIEVGVDVPNATWMVIESAERFGLAQLHQLRGRVGRGSRASCCIAIHDRLGENARRRLKVFVATTDGFRIAEADLEIRGPGELLGTRQAGIPVFRAANLVRDREWLQRARTDARELLQRLDDRELEPLLDRVRPRARSRYERFAGG